MIAVKNESGGCFALSDFEIDHLRRSFGIRKGGYLSADEAPWVNIHDDEDERSFEIYGLDLEKVDGPDGLVLLEKVPPVFGALTVPTTKIGPPQNIADRGFRDIDSDLKEFTSLQQGGDGICELSRDVR